MADNLMFLPLPHCDLHLVINRPLNLDVKVVSRGTEADRTHVVRTVRNATFDGGLHTLRMNFLAQHGEPPNRLQNLPVFDPATGNITAATPGVFLFQIGVFRDATPLGSIVGRLQVHRDIVDWWFGNKSITTAKHATIAHAQPTIYARFSDDGSGADVVGDITGHDYVTLTSQNTNKVRIADRGWLLGVAESTGPTDTVTVSGAMTLGNPGREVRHDLDVRVIDYARARGDELRMVRLASTQDMAKRSNIVFVAEGFRTEDEPLFTRAVTEATKQMFTAARHYPFSDLSERYNVFELFAPSQERGLTTGFPVTDTLVPVKAGLASRPGLTIPYGGKFGGLPQMPQGTLARLISLVGLPARGESRAPGTLRDHWRAQRPERRRELDSPDFTDDVIALWKAQRADAFLDAVDTRFGFYLGGRFADCKPADTLTPPVAVPAADNPADPATQAFVNRLYTFFQPKAQIEVTPDPRRHPPELYSRIDLVNAGFSLFGYLGGQTFTHPFDLPGQSTPIGKEWVPAFDANGNLTSTLSRGLAVVVTYENVAGGVAFNKQSTVAVTVASAPPPMAVTPAQDNRARLTRNLPQPTPQQPLGIVDPRVFTSRTTHELGHVYNLGDEDEASRNTDPVIATDAEEFPADQITNIGSVRVNQNARDIDVSKVKWFALPRMLVASRLTQAAKPAANGTIQVQVNNIGQWVALFDRAPGTRVSLRMATVAATRGQLPLKPKNPSLFLDDLQVKGRPDPSTGTVVLSFPTPLPNPVPEFVAGSALYVPKTRGANPVLVVDDAVRAFLANTRQPLNSGRDLNTGTNEPQAPRPIPGFAMPRNSPLVVGIFEGGNLSSRGYYRPTGTCKMRNLDDPDDEHGAFCFVCRWLLVNVVDPGRHTLLDEKYPR